MSRTCFAVRTCCVGVLRIGARCGGHWLLIRGLSGAFGDLAYGFSGKV